MDWALHRSVLFMCGVDDTKSVHAMSVLSRPWVGFMTDIPDAGADFNHPVSFDHDNKLLMPGTITSDRPPSNLSS